MKNMQTTHPISLLPIAILAATLAAADLPTGKPEDAGMSSERLRRIHEAIQRHIDAGEISGAVTLVARRGRLVHFEAHGLMDIESKRPMQKDAIFRIASMSKPITGVAVMMMLEEGKLRLNDPVSKFLPEFKDSKVAVARGASGQFYLVPADRDLTIRDLLTHTNGLMTGGVGSKAGPPRPAAGDTLAAYVPRLAAVPLDFQPGTQWAYSGLAGPDTLSRIVELVSGQTYDEFLRTRIFEPLGMRDTFFYPPDDRRPRLATLYSKSPNGLMRAENQDGFSLKTYFSGGGGLMSTAEDYLQFAQMLLNGGELHGSRLLSPRTVDLMESNQVGDMFNGKLGRPAHGMGYGLLVGIVEDSVAAGLRVSTGSFGWDGAYGTQTWIDPREKMVTIVMIQTQVSSVQRDFENAVMQAIVE
ncbi:MAG TPA: serine hydrolase domain-containing protein [Bryobacteraceae bacterium]|nr:serine hydrolase domain-containing protein [Bryobacteraceae bacterium]